MSKPSFSNIDLWLFELAEGNLSKSQIEQLELFLLQHPDLDIDRDAWESAKIIPREVVYTKTEEHTRRKPLALYGALGATTISLLLLIGLYQYVNIEDESTKELIASKNHPEAGSGKVQSVEEELYSLKLQLKELKNENAILQAKLAYGYATHDMESVESYSTESESQRNEIEQGRGINDVREAEKNGIFASTDASADSKNRIMNSGDMANSYNGRVIEPRKAVVIDFEPGWSRKIQPYSSRSTGGNTEMKIAFKTKVDRALRSVQRMMDNPVALKNSRDPHYLIPGVLPQDVNFGAVGTLLTTRVQTLSRLQWYGQDNEQFMNQIAVDGYAYGMRGGFGIQLNHTMYKDGGIHVGDVALTYSPKFSLNHVISVEPSLRFKMGNKYLDHMKMNGVSGVETERGNVYDYYPDGTTPIGKSLWYKDMGAGLMVNTKWFFAGIQGDNLLHHRDNIYSNDLSNQRRAQTEIYGTIGTDWESRNEKMTLSAYSVYHKNGALQEGWLGFNYRWEWFNVGAAVSTNLEPAASVGVKFKRFAMHYNADYVNSSLLGSKALSHQVTLRIQSKPSRVGQRILNL